MIAILVAASAPSIPFRESAPLSGGDVAAAFAWTVGLLVVALVFAIVAKRRGWLARWGVATAATPAAGLRVEQVLRLSARTTLYRVGDGHERYLVAETREGVQLLPLRAADTAGDAAPNAGAAATEVRDEA